MSDLQCYGRRCIFPRCLCGDKCDARKVVTQPPDLHWQLLPQYERELAAERAAVPNRLYGATINPQGEAI